MVVRTPTLYRTLCYALLAAYMLAPALNYRLGIPRIDHPITWFAIAAAIIAFWSEHKTFPKPFFATWLPLVIMSGWAVLHISWIAVSATTFADIMLFAVLPAYAYLLFAAVRHGGALAFIRRFITVFALFITLPALIELISGFQFVYGDEAFAITAGTIKGLFFNPNNLATAALCLSPAVLFFFHSIEPTQQSRLKGWLLFLLLGGIIFAAASRTAIAVYLLLTLFFIAYRENGLTTPLAIGLAALVFMAIPPESIQHFLLSLNGNEFLERVSSRLYLFLYDFESDNSISYRQEIYDYFRSHPPFLITGYGPRNFIGYFGGHLSNSLGFTNPHSFLIEVYLAFGLVSLLGFLSYAIAYLATVWRATGIPSKSRLVASSAIAVFFVAGFIPSTIMRMPFIWLPCILIMIYLATRRLKGTFS